MTKATVLRKIMLCGCFLWSCWALKISAFVIKQLAQPCNTQCKSTSQLKVIKAQPLRELYKGLIQEMDALLLCPCVAEHNGDDAKVRFMVPPRH